MVEKKKPVGPEELRNWNLTLAKYRAGKRSLDRRIREAEEWWRLRNRFCIDRRTDPKSEGFRACSSWLHNVITSKHADALAAYPVPNILPRGEEDRAEAELLSRLIPAVLRQNRFESTYDDVSWQKLKTGTGVYKVIWDPKKAGGLGDVVITRRSLLSLFWEPGICELQDSRCVFDVEMTDRELLTERYPELAEQLRADLNGVAPIWKSPGEDPVPDTDRVPVVDVYYHKNGRLHYCKYVGETVLYATENDPLRAERGLYDHGSFPFVFDPLFPVEGSPAGYGFVDICADSQLRIDLLNTALLRNALASATPRYFTRSDGGLNEEELLNLENTLIHVNGGLGEDHIRPMVTQSLSGSQLAVLNATVQELRETTGNTETSTGNTGGGVTAAAAIAALQDAAGKGSRAAAAASYRAYSEVVYLVIELIRQFYDVPRQFRIAGPGGAFEFLRFGRGDLRERSDGQPPVYDIEVVPEKRTDYTRLAQNELALQFYNSGFFRPELAPQALQAIDMMEFDGKDRVRNAIAEAAGYDGHSI